jgi:quinol monooxygenase YgiN
MVGGLKVILVKAGHEPAFESLFAELRQIMRDHEPDCLLYSLLKSRQPALLHRPGAVSRPGGAHQTSPHGKVYFPKMRAILETITVEYFDVVVP